MGRVLHLRLKKKWFDMIASGEKKEEYRDLTEYWQVRLVDHIYDQLYDFKKFDEVYFKNGYLKDSPFLKVKCKGIRIGEGKPEWGAEPGKKYFVIELGEIL